MDIIEDGSDKKKLDSLFNYLAEEQAQINVIFSDAKWVLT